LVANKYRVGLRLDTFRKDLLPDVDDSNNNAVTGAWGFFCSEAPAEIQSCFPRH
jgi:hypothetical protein